MKTVTKEKIAEFSEAVLGGNIGELVRKAYRLEKAGNLHIPEKEAKQLGSQRVYNAKAALEEKTEVCRLEANETLRELGTVKERDAGYWMQRSIYNDFAAISNLVSGSAALTGQQRKEIEHSITDITLSASTAAEKISARFAIAAYINTCKGD